MSPDARTGRAAPSEVYLARQPIFDRRLRIAGYELLFRRALPRSGDAADTVDKADSAAREADERDAIATTTVVLNALTEIGLERIVGPHPVWINLTREFLLDGLAEALPAGRTCFEVLEDEVIDPPFLSALAELKQRGYRIALDDFTYREELQDLVELADCVKLDYLALGDAGLAGQLELLHGYDGKLLAEKVETHAAHARCAALGFDYFQGFFYRKPELMARRRIEFNRAGVLRVLAAVQDPRLGIDDVEPLIARDVTLSLRLLRYINSAFFALSQEIVSIHHALMLLGVQNVRRWATLTVLGSIDSKPSELTVAALVRARFCELGAATLGIDAAKLFTVGLFSLLDAMLDTPLEQALAELPFPADVRDALLSHSGTMGAMLDAVASMERGYFGDAVTLLPGAAELYVQALSWANDASAALFASIR